VLHNYNCAVLGLWSVLGGPTLTQEAIWKQVTARLTSFSGAKGGYSKADEHKATRTRSWKLNKNVTACFTLNRQKYLLFVCDSLQFSGLLQAWGRRWTDAGLNRMGWADKVASPCPLQNFLVGSSQCIKRSRSSITQTVITQGFRCHQQTTGYCFQRVSTMTWWYVQVEKNKLSSCPCANYQSIVHNTTSGRQYPFRSPGLQPIPALRPVTKL
jgi:hypothetical protein